MIAGILLFSSCETFEEGPNFTLTSKNARLTRTWILDSINNSIVNDEISWTFEKGGNHTKMYNGFESNNPAIWSFGNDKTLEIYYINDNMTEVYTILKLTITEMILLTTQGGNELRYAFKAE